MKKLLCVTAIAATISVPAAMAGKSDGVLRMAFQDPIEKIDEVFDPKGETGFTSRAVNANVDPVRPSVGRLRRLGGGKLFKRRSIDLGIQAARRANLPGRIAADGGGCGVLVQFPRARRRAIPPEDPLGSLRGCRSS